ncbi:MAG: response regulator, partial [Verrucomicrobiota bacterium]
MSSDHSLKVLIVEDDGVTARDIEAILHRRGFAVSGIANRREAALESIQQIRPDVALIDIRLDNAVAGTELATELREQHRLPVIFVTGYSEDAVYEQASEAKPAAFIRKPFSDAELSACLNAVHENRSAIEALASQLPGIAAIANELDEAVIVSDREGHIAYLNPTAGLLSGWAPAEAIGKSQKEVFELSESENHRSQIKSREGEIAEVAERSSAIRSDDGEVVGVMTLLTRGEVPHPALLASNPEEANSKTGDDGMPPARADALKKIAAISKDPAFRELIRHREDSQDSSAVATDQGTEEIAETPPAELPPPSHEPLIEDVTDPLVKINNAGRVTYANQEATAVFGNGKNLVGLTFWDRFSTSEFEQYDEPLHRPLATGRSNHFEFNDTSRHLWFEVRSYRTD